MKWPVPLQQPAAVAFPQHPAAATGTEQEDFRAAEEDHGGRVSGGQVRQGLQWGAGLVWSLDRNFAGIGPT